MSPTTAHRTDYSQRKERWQSAVAGCRQLRWESSRAYQQVVGKMLTGLVPAGARVLQVGCGSGDLLAMLCPSFGVGIEPSGELVAEANRRHPSLHVVAQSIDDFQAEGRFDFVLVSDVLIDCFDVDDLLACVRRCCSDETRVIITIYSQLWRPLLKILRAFRLAKPRFGNTWFSPHDLAAALTRCGFELITASPEILLPVRIPVLSDWVNRFLARVPLLRHFCLHYAMIARKASAPLEVPQTVSVIVPARNEAGNVCRLLREIPAMGDWTEVIFVEGNSTDNTREVLAEAIRRKGDPRIRLIGQPGIGKGDAVRAGFAEARGDILMILDADLTVPAEVLPRFYRLVASGLADLANGTRLVYGMDERAMRFLNLLANHFFAMAFRFVLGQPVRDTLCGTKVLRRSLYERIAAQRAYFGDFDPFGDFDLLFGAARLHAKIVDVPVRYRERVYGETNISRFRHGAMLFRMLGVGASKLKFR